MRDHPRTFTPTLNVSADQQKEAATEIVDDAIQRGRHTNMANLAMVRARNISQVFHEVRDAPALLAALQEADTHSTPLGDIGTMEELRWAAKDSLRGIAGGTNALEANLRTLAIAVLRLTTPETTP